MIEEILPAEVASAEAFDDPPGAMLFPKEEAALGRSVEKRRREFTTARLCARRALAQLGQPEVAIPRGLHGEPQWPAGLVGSITHCAGYRAAAVAHATQVAALGIDAEPNDVLPKGVLEVIATAEERARLHALARADSRVRWDRLLFSAKEAIYKAWFPVTRRFLGFQDAIVVIDPVGARFSARLLVPGLVLAGRRLRDLPGRWLVRDGLVLTAIVLPAADKEASQGNLEFGMGRGSQIEDDAVCDARPLSVPGPHDDVDAIPQTLERSVCSPPMLARPPICVSRSDQPGRYAAFTCSGSVHNFGL